MKKVAVITLSASDNCGSLLQTYALQEILEKKCNCHVTIINLITEQSKAIYDVFPKDFYRHPRKTLFTLKHFRSIQTQKNGYQLFREKHLKLTNEIYDTVDAIESIVNDFDILITGSDQVWNVYMSDYSDAFYLPWKTTAKKVAYATSLGSTVKIDKEKAKKLSTWLSEFERISVREKSGKETIASLTDKEITITADPTLLLSKEEWSDLAKKDLIGKPYIFYYSWSYPDEEMNRIVQKFAQTVAMDVYVINSSKWYKFRPEKFDFVLYEESGPIVFLNLMKYATYVFVQSFHGTVFANIFKKNFFFLNENKNIDFRSRNLLELLNEEERAVSTYQEVEEVMNKRLEYTTEAFLKLVDTSMDFLKGVIAE